MANESDAVAALQWVYDNKDAYNIRVVNLSINSTAEQSYHASPLDAAAEILWFNGIVVVASAGNTRERDLVQHRQHRARQRPLRHHRGRERREVDSSSAAMTDGALLGPRGDHDGFVKPE